MSSLNDGYVGHGTAADPSSDYNRIAAVVTQMQAQQAGSGLVTVVAVYPPPAGQAIGRVDVVPMVHQIDGQGNVVPHGTIHNVPYVRMQGGASAVIMDPAVGDRGACVFSDRDATVVKATAAPGPPGSRRLNSMSDALYVGGMLNGAPTQFVDFTGGQVRVVSPTKITLQAPAVEVVSQDVRFTGDGGTVEHNGVSIGQQHRHYDQGVNQLTSVPI